MGAHPGPRYPGGLSVGGVKASPACVFSSRSGSRDVAGGRKHGAGHLHPSPHHLLAAGRSLHLHHQVGAWGRGLPSAQPAVCQGLGTAPP